MNPDLRFVPRTDVKTIEVFVEEAYLADITKDGQNFTINNIALTTEDIEAILEKMKELKRLKEAKK